MFPAGSAAEVFPNKYFTFIRGIIQMKSVFLIPFVISPVIEKFGTESSFDVAFRNRRYYLVGIHISYGKGTQVDSSI